MRGERALLRLGEYLVGRACLRLPDEIRDERYREWAAELPAILHDPEIRPAARRAVRMLGYAADTLRGTALSAGRSRRHPAGPPALVPGLLFMAGLATVAWAIGDMAQAPGRWLNYVQLAWSLSLMAWPISEYVRSTARTTGLIVISGDLAGITVCTVNAAQAPGDWVNYLAAAWLCLLLAAWWLTRRWAREYS